VISPELQQFISAGLSILVGSADRESRPFAVRAVAARVDGGGAELLTYVPDVLAGTTLANVRRNPRLAVCFGRPEDHRTIQLKGPVLEVRPARDDEREVVDSYRVAFARTMAFVGLPPEVTMRFALWPCHMLRVRVEQVFSQTPGPNAGERIGGEPA